MKNITKKLNIGLFLIAVVGLLVSPLAFGAKTASAMTCNSATITGTVTVGAPPVHARFEYSTNSGAVSSGSGITTPVQAYSTIGSYQMQQLLTGLIENTTYYYRITTTGGNGTGNGAILSFTTPPCANTSLPTVNLTADDTSITSGDSTILRWNSNNADTCVASGGTNGWSGTRNLDGTFNTGSLTSSKTYTINCSNGSGSATDSVTVNVTNTGGGNINVDISADDTSLDYGDSTIVRWDTDNADDCRASSGTNGWSGDRNTSGTFRTGSLTSDTTYRIRCTNNDGDSDSDLVTVRVNDNNNTSICRDYSATNYLGTAPCRYNTIIRPTVSIYADNTNLTYNGATTVRWSSTNATSCYASGGSIGWAGTKSIGPASFYTGSLTSTRTYSINCSNDSGSSSDFVTVNVRGQVLGTTTIRPTASSYLLVTSSVDRNRPIVPTLDNTNPCPGDDINYSITYRNVGNASLTNLVLRVDLPQEVDYIASTPSNPNQSGQTLIFNLGTLRANGEGTVKIQVRLRNDVAPGTNLNFPATLSYTDATGATQSVNANVNASVCQPTFTGNTNDNGTMSLGAAVFGAGFLPTSILGWLFLLILILILVLLAKYLFGQSFNQKKTVVMVDQFGNERTTTTSTHQ